MEEKPEDMLRDEHDIIEQILDIIEDRIGDIEGGKVSYDYINKLIEFFDVFTDQNHHGKEEEIITKLKGKNLDKLDDMIMDELIVEHRYVNKVVNRLKLAIEKYKDDRLKFYEMVSDAFWRLMRFYPLHAEKEDTNFFDFIPMYFSPEEQQEITKSIEDINQSFDYQRFIDMIDELEDY